MRIIRYEYELLPVQGGGIEFSHPPLPSFEIEGGGENSIAPPCSQKGSSTLGASINYVDVILDIFDLLPLVDRHSFLGNPPPRKLCGVLEDPPPAIAISILA